MKKFNSLFASVKSMKVLAIAVVALTSVFGLSSCEKDDDSFNQQQEEVYKAPVEMKDSYLLVAATAEQLKYMDATFTVTTSNQTIQVKLSDMTEAKESAHDRFVADALHLEKSFNDGAKDEVKFFEFNLGKVCNAKVTLEKYHALVGQIDYEINIFSGATIVSGRVYDNGKSDVRYFKGISNIEGFVENIL